MEVERGVDLRAQHPVDLAGRDGGQGGIVQHTGRVHHRGQRMLVRYAVQQPFQCRAVGGVAGRQGDLGSQGGEFRA
ncbi:hypothetical protein SGLAM104S_05581 [Streptomyces glaucescens]